MLEIGSARVVRQGIGLLGGTFDPVHNGHLAAARAALETFNLGCVEFVPARAPWQKAFVTPARIRLEMLKLALEDEPDFRVNELELLRSGPTYTIDTLEAIRSRLGPGYPLVLILGGDQWLNFHTWRSWQRLADYANIAVCERAGEPIRANPSIESWAAARRVEAKELTRHASGAIAFFSMPSHKASATAIRSMLGTQPFPDAMRRVGDWLPFPVAAYIAAHGLYGTRSGRF